MRAAIAMDTPKGVKFKANKINTAQALTHSRTCCAHVRNEGRRVMIGGSYTGSSNSDRRHKRSRTTMSLLCSSHHDNHCRETASKHHQQRGALLSSFRHKPTHVSADSGRAQVERETISFGDPILVLQHKLAKHIFRETRQGENNGGGSRKCSGRLNARTFKEWAGRWCRMMCVGQGRGFFKARKVPK